ncbi:hypothetical protein D3C79_607500 [compost metagenome]
MASFPSLPPQSSPFYPSEPASPSGADPQCSSAPPGDYRLLSGLFTLCQASCSQAFSVYDRATFVLLQLTKRCCYHPRHPKVPPAVTFATAARIRDEKPRRESLSADLALALLCRPVRRPLSDPALPHRHGVSVQAPARQPALSRADEGAARRSRPECRPTAGQGPKRGCAVDQGTDRHAGRQPEQIPAPCCPGSERPVCRQATG